MSRAANICAYILVSVALYFVIQIPGGKFDGSFWSEDNVLEWLQFGMLLAAAAFFLLSNRACGFRNIWLWGLFLVCAFVAGEEISWGQRIFGFRTPAVINAMNTQHEFTLHNMPGIQQHKVNIATVILGVLYVGIPAAYRWNPALRGWLSKRAIPICPWSAVGLYIITFVMLRITRRFLPQYSAHGCELAETLFYVHMLIFAVSQYRRAISPQTSAAQTAEALRNFKVA